ncbi:MAG: radical SAM protein [Nitrospinota bacterium]
MLRVSKLWNGYVTPEEVERAGRKASEGMPGHLLAYTTDCKPVVVWNATRRCNLSCIHCYSDSENKAYGGELSTEEARRMIDGMAEFGAPAILFSGGEPLVRKDIYELLRYARSRGIRPTLSTNGTLITERAARNLRAAGLAYVGVSLDGFGEVNDRFRGQEGAFERAVRGIENCQAAGIPVGLRFTITRHNVGDLPKIFDFIEEKNIPRCCFYHLVYAGRGSEINRDDLTGEETMEVVDQIVERAEYFHRGGIEKDIVTVDNHSDAPYLYAKLLKKDRKCAQQVYTLLRWQGGNRSGIAIADVDNLGNVHADQFSWDYSFGNVRDRKFGDIWTDTTDPVLAGYRDRKPLLKGKCAGCPFLELTNGNFRARAHYAFGDRWAEDPACYCGKVAEMLGIEWSKPAEVPS